MLQSPLSWFGGKYYLVKQHNIQKYIPPQATKREVYVELFAGAATMFFNLHTAPCGAILNDVDKNLMNFWSVIRNKRTEFEIAMEFVFADPVTFNEFKARTDEVGRAVFFYLQNIISWCGTTCSVVNFHYNAFGNKFYRTFKEWGNKLDASNTVIWDLDCRAALERLHSKASTFFIYADPPYLQGGDRYADCSENKWTMKDHEELAAVLNASDHHIILSYGDHPVIRKLYSGWRVLSFKSNHGTHGATGKAETERFDELLLSNRPFHNHTPSSLDLFL